MKIQHINELKTTLTTLSGLPTYYTAKDDVVDNVQLYLKYKGFEWKQFPKQITYRFELNLAGSLLGEQALANYTEAEIKISSLFNSPYQQKFSEIDPHYTNAEKTNFFCIEFDLNKLELVVEDDKKYTANRYFQLNYTVKL